jgi:membrane protein implicated in regulation of membrane protease activity
MLKFLPGLVIIQIAAGALAVTGTASAGGTGWALAATISLTLTVVVALWFASMTEHIKKDAIAGVKESFSRDRETLLVSAETEKRTIVEESHRRIVEETNRAHARANFKLGAAVVGMVGIAGVLIYIQLFTLALVTATTAGGALAGYVARARQDLLGIRRRAGAVADDTPDGVIDLRREDSPKLPVHRASGQKRFS